MFKITLAALVTLLMMSSTAFADGGCSPDKVPGSYTRSDPQPDTFGNGSMVARTYVFQLNLNSDGTAYQYWTGFPDFLIELGTGSPFVGSWKCRSDGKLVVVLINAEYNPVSISPGTGLPTADIELILHSRYTYLFSVETNNTLKRLKARTRRYGPTEDPSDPTAGTLFPASSLTVIYKRLKASDADLFLP